MILSRTLLIALLLIGNGFAVQSQPDSSNLGWKVGLNSGLFISSNHPASFYNGKEGNENTATFILNNPFHYQEIFQLLNATDTFKLKTLPSRMKYNPTLMIGIYFRNNFRENMAWFVQVNQTHLKAADFYSLEVDPKPNILTDPDIRSFMIWGEEQRFHFDVGISREFEGPSSFFTPYLDGGFSLTNTRVEVNKIKVYDRDYSLINIYGKNGYIPGGTQQTFQVEQGGVGFGGFLNVGIKMHVNNYFSLDPTMQFYLTTTNLPPYQQLRPHFFFNIRLMANNLFLFKEKHL